MKKQGFISLLFYGEVYSFVFQPKTFIDNDILKFHGKSNGVVFGNKIQTTFAIVNLIVLKVYKINELYRVCLYGFSIFQSE